MSSIPSGQNKVKLIGRVMTWLAIVAIFGSFLLGAVTVLLITKFEISAVIDWVNTSLLSADRFNSLADNSGFKQLMIEDGAFFDASRHVMITYVVCVCIVNLTISFFVIRMGKSWKKGVLLDAKVIQALKWIGIMFFISGAQSQVIGYLLDTPTAIYFTPSHIYMLIMSAQGGMGPFAIGLILLALSYILKYSRDLESEASLTI